MVFRVDPDVLGDALALDGGEAGGEVVQVIHARREDGDGEDEGGHGGDGVRC